MTNDQDSKSGKLQKLSLGARLASAGVCCLITAGAAVLWASANNHINLRGLLGICGFKQRFGLPCPGCGWTHAAQAFFTGHLLEAFNIQPAAAFFCIVAVITAFFALHRAVFGIDFSFLKNLFRSAAGISLLLISAIIVILAGWAVTLMRAILENTGH